MQWRVEFFGGPCLISPQGERTDRFVTQKVAGLLAYLALTQPRRHSREVLAELFWPDRDPLRSRNSLSGAVFALRQLLGDALLADRLTVGLAPDAITSDLAELRAGLASTSAPWRAEDFLAGFYDDWVVVERERLRPLLESPALPTPPASLQGFPFLENEFVGRGAEQAQLAALLADKTRLITLKGIGGVGKTRLAYEVSRRCSHDFPGGILWLSLEDVSQADALLRRLAATLALPPEHAQLADLTRALAQKRRHLLVLDNTEQIPNLAPLVHHLLTDVPACVCLITSRQRLNLRSEHLMELAPLPLLDAESLFLERATMSGGIAITAGPTITELCRRLDGLPLALELAAARAATLTPEQLLSRLESRFQLLQSRTSDLPDRQKNLRTTIDWSHEALAPRIQTFFAQLSVFVGPFSLEDAETVTEEAEAAENLSILRECSLLSTVPHPRRAHAHFVLLESLRDYAAERLAEHPALLPQVQARHASHFLALAQHQLARLRTHEEPTALRELDLLAPNLQAALTVAPPVLVPAIALAIARPLQRRGFFTEASLPLEKGLATARLPELIWERAGLHYDQGELALACQLACEAHRGFSERGDALGVAQAENLLGQVSLSEKAWPAAREAFRRALKALPDSPPTPLERAIIQNNLALVELAAPDGDPELAIQLLREALEARRFHGDSRGVAVVANNLGNLAFARHDWDASWQHFTEALTVERTLENVFGIARALNNLGETAEQRGAPLQALRLYHAAHELFVRLQHDFAHYTAELRKALVTRTPEAAQLPPIPRNQTTEEVVQWALS